MDNPNRCADVIVNHILEELPDVVRTILIKDIAGISFPCLICFGFNPRFIKIIIIKKIKNKSSSHIRLTILIVPIPFFIIIIIRRK